MKRLFPGGGFALAAGLAMLSLAEASLLHAQLKGGSRVGTGQDRLQVEKDYTKGEGKDELALLGQMSRGEQPVAGSEAVLDRAAKWFAYRFTHVEHQEAKPGVKSMQDLRKEVTRILDPVKRQPTPAQQAFMEEFGKRLTARLQEVVTNPKTIARINAAMILAELAKIGQEEATGVLADVVLDHGETDAVKLWAFRGLHDYFALLHGNNALPGFKDKTREEKCIAALMGYIERHVPQSDKTPPGEVEAFHYIRRHAIAALAETRYPAATKNGPNKTVIFERPTALLLLRVMARDGIVPEPNIEEQVSAAAGLCRMQTRLLDQYNVDYAAYQLGQFIVELVGTYDSKPQAERPVWRLYALDLMHGLEDLKEDAVGPPAHAEQAYVVKLVGQMEPLIKEMLESKNEKEGLNLDVGPLRAYLQQNPPKNNSLYKGLMTAVLRSKNIEQ